MDEIIIGYGSLMSADGLRDSDKAKDLSDAFKGYLVVNFPKGKRGFWKRSESRGCFTMDISEFTFHCEEVPLYTPRPKEGFQCVALVVDAQDPKKLNHLEKIRKREGYPECAWKKIIEEATFGNTSVAKCLWNNFSFTTTTLEECQWETVRSKLKEYRQCLARLDNGTGLCGRHIPVPIKIGEDKFGIVSYADSCPRSIADALKWSKEDNFVEYVSQCLLAKCHGVEVSDISAQLEEIPDLRQGVEGYIRCKASQEAGFPQPLGNEADPPLEK